MNCSHNILVFEGGLKVEPCSQLLPQIVYWLEKYYHNYSMHVLAASVVKGFTFMAARCPPWPSGLEHMGIVRCLTSAQGRGLGLICRRGLLHG